MFRIISNRTACFFLFYVLLSGIQSLEAASFTVDNNTDTDNGTALAPFSLRKCIRLANSTAGADVINFAILPSGPVYTITLLSALPLITDIVTINGFTQGGAAAGNLKIEINGLGQTNCIQLDPGSAGSTIKGLVLNRANRGLYINASNGNFILGNFIGTDPTGALASANIWNGIEINASANNTIGGTGGIADRNIISGNAQVGIRIQGVSSGSVIIGNYIGTNAAGTAALANGWHGIYLLATCNNTVIGGSVANSGNLISGNANHGILVEGSTDVSIKGNIIGLDQTATAAIPNIWNGIFINSGCHRPIVGGTGVNERNIISGNNSSGLEIIGSTNASIQGNYVGVDISGNIAIGNKANGIKLTNASNSGTIGGTTAASRNIVSANSWAGIFIDQSTDCSVKANIIGLGLNGTTSLGNLQAGIQAGNLSHRLVIGGSTVPERNLVSSNSGNGLDLSNSTNMVIKNNYIGVDVSGNIAKGNGAVGIRIVSNSNFPTVGGTVAGEGNIVSGNGQIGIYIDQSTDAILKGNIVGLGLDKTTPIGNGQPGLVINNLSHRAIIGGATSAEMNIVSKNGGNGIEITNSTNAVVKGNYVGVDGSGNLARSNRGNGIRITVNSNFPTVGGSLPGEGNISSSNGSTGILIDLSTDAVIKGNIVGLGLDKTTLLPDTGDGIAVLNNSHRAVIGGASVQERNYSSGNIGTGININQCNNVSVVGNYCGVDGTGLLNRGNKGNGISAFQCLGLVIGGSTFSSRNIASGNGGDGINLNHLVTGAIVKANFSGVGSDGLTVISNWGNGLFIGDSSNQCIIGGSTLAERNVLSGNGASGVGDGLRSLTCSRTVIKGNYCGVDSSGTLMMSGAVKLGNAWAGISINEGKGCIVGGSGANEGNICSGNQNEGVYFRNDTSIVFLGNYIGCDKTGTISLGNEDWGLNIRGRNSMNIVGGSLSARNIIAFNRNIAGNGPGVFVEGGSQNNEITFNKIYCNAGLGIELNATANESILAPVITATTATSISGTGSVNGDSIHVYTNSITGAGCDCEGEIYLGSTVVTGTTWTLTGLTLTAAQQSSATATETTLLKSTSQFSNCLSLPIKLVSFSAERNDDGFVMLSWLTASEQNNSHFDVERSLDGINFAKIGQVDGNGTSLQNKSYNFTDLTAAPGTSYYRLRQVDLNGSYTYSGVRSISNSGENIFIASHDNQVNIYTRFDHSKIVNYEIHSVTGVKVAEGKYEAPAGASLYSFATGINAAALYIITVHT
ncbi:MAG: beta strand repeat-containing protein, partial [Cytophagaceae bacterium]